MACRYSVHINFKGKMKTVRTILLFWFKNIYLVIIGVILVTQIDYEKVKWIGYVFIFEYLGRCIYFTYKFLQKID